MNDSIFTKMMISLQESKAEKVKENLKALKESKTKKLNEEVCPECNQEECVCEEDKDNEVEEVTESVSQDSQIKTTNKGTEIKKVNGIKPATGKDGIPAEATKKGKKLDSMNENPDATGDTNIASATKKKKLEKKLNESEDIKNLVYSVIEPTITGGGFDDEARAQLESIFGKDKVQEMVNKASDYAMEESDMDDLIERICKEFGILNESKELTEDADLTIKTGGKVIEVSDECEDCEELAPVIDDIEVPEEEDEFLDESTFNPFLTKFIRDNYSNAKAVVVECAKLNNERLKLECKLIFNSGKTSKFDLALEGIMRGEKISTLRASDNGFFKAESMKRPLAFKVSYKDHTIKCEGLEYNFKTKLSEGKMKVIKGKLIRG